MNYHTLSPTETLAALEVNPQTGLTEEAAKERLLLYGPNALQEAPQTPLWKRFLAQFSDFMIFVLFAAAAISFGVSWYEGKPDYIEPLIILAIILLNACMGLLQELKAEHSLQALRTLSTPKVPVLRDGVVRLCISTELVPGDIFHVETGQIIPADGRLLSSVNLQISEASLTGESLPVHKNAEQILRDTCVPADRKNCVFSSSVVTTGHGIAVVTATGHATEIGKIAKHLTEAEAPETPLGRRLASVGKALGILCLLICAGVFLLGIWQGRPPLAMLLTSVSLAVAAIPEGLPAVVTIMLSIGVERMAKKHAVIRRLPAVETLGSATYICSDKTGTLTQNKMTAAKCYAGKEVYRLTPLQKALPPEVGTLLHSASLCCNSDGTNGDPTENALVNAAKAYNAITPTAFRRVREFPFSSERKAMLVIGKEPSGNYLVIAKGAPDILLRVSTSSIRQAAENVHRSFAEEGLRMLGVATKKLSEADYIALSHRTEEEAFRSVCSGLTYLGTIALQDPPRPECFASVMQCRQAGITPVMITGDHPLTASAIAKELGIALDDKVITGAELTEMSQEELINQVADTRVYARVQPEHKVRIVQALQARGEVVAMTGDGVNDAPALKQADIGCAMGEGGTDVAKNAADMILTDDNFATIVAAVREGRGIYGNIRKAIHFLLSCNAGEILLIVFAMLLGLPAPLAAIHLLWINLVTDSLPAIALAMEPPEENIMKRSPIPANESLFSKPTVFRILLEGFLIALLALIAYERYGTTCCFFVLGCSELLHTLNIKNDRSLFRSGLRDNPFLLGSVLLGIVLQFATVSIPAMQMLFQTTALTMQGWKAGILLSLVPIAVVEIEKCFFCVRRKGSKMTLR